MLLMAYEYDEDKPMRLTVSNFEGDSKYESELEDDSEFEVMVDSEYESESKDES